MLASRSLTRASRGLYRSGPVPNRGRYLLSGGRCDPGFVAEVRHALLSAGSGARAARRTAAVLWRFDLLVEPTAVELDLPHGRRAGAGVRQSRRTGDALVVPVPCCAPVPVSSAVDTVLDCALGLPLVEAVVLADSALRAGACTVRQLRRAVTARRGTAGVGRLWRVLRWCDPRSESVLESALRVVLCEAGLVPPSTQEPLGRHRVDLAWPDLRLAVEADGRRWHDPDDRRDADRRRDNDAARAGWRVLRFTWAEVVHAPQAVVAAVREALAQAK
jgi:very-short-patch-repair endonuclease